MTGPVSAYDAMVSKEPTAWRDQGIHWHCYAWTGTGAEYANDAARSDNTAAYPPVMVREWLNKPHSMLRHTTGTPDEALRWLREQRTALRDLHPTLQTQIDWPFRYKFALYDLRLGNDIQWDAWIPGPRKAILAVIGTATGCHRH